MLGSYNSFGGITLKNSYLRRGSGAQNAKSISMKYSDRFCGKKIHLEGNKAQAIILFWTIRFLHGFFRASLLFHRIRLLLGVNSSPVAVDVFQLQNTQNYVFFLSSPQSGQVLESSSGINGEKYECNQRKGTSGRRGPLCGENRTVTDLTSAQTGSLIR